MRGIIMHGLTKEEKLLSKEEVKKKLFELENSEVFQGELVRYYRILLKYKRVEERMKFEDKIRQKLSKNRISGNYQPEDVAKVIGGTKRQAMVIEKKALAKLKSPKLGKQIKGALFL